MDRLLHVIHQQLGITTQHLESNRLTFQRQPDLKNLEVVDIDFEGKPFILVNSAAQAWRNMQSEAQKEQIFLRPFSGFRSYQHQKNLIEWHLKNGRALEKILTHIAIPGFSEHHTGRAIDIHAQGRNLLEEEFEHTPEFKWLYENAARFGFRLSYPRANPHGIVYEPWHWFFEGD